MHFLPSPNLHVVGSEYMFGLMEKNNPEICGILNQFSYLKQADSRDITELAKSTLNVKDCKCLRIEGIFVLPGWGELANSI